MLYSKNSPAIMSQLLFMLFVNFLAWQEEGMKGVKACWQIPKGASIFIVIGLEAQFYSFDSLCWLLMLFCCFNFSRTKNTYLPTYPSSFVGASRVRSLVCLWRLLGNAFHWCHERWSLSALTSVQALDHRSDDEAAEGHYPEWLGCLFFLPCACFEG